MCVLWVVGLSVLFRWRACHVLTHRHSGGGRHDTCGVGPRRRCSLHRVQILSLCSLTCHTYLLAGGCFHFIFIHLGGTFGVDLKHCSLPICPIPPLFFVLIPIHLVSLMCAFILLFLWDVKDVYPFSYVCILNMSVLL